MGADMGGDSGNPLAEPRRLERAYEPPHGDPLCQPGETGEAFGPVGGEPKLRGVVIVLQPRHPLAPGQFPDAGAIAHFEERQFAQR